MIPGMGHCGVLPDANGVDEKSLNVLEALENWVEKGTAPRTILKPEAGHRPM